MKNLGTQVLSLIYSDNYTMLSIKEIQEKLQIPKKNTANLKSVIENYLKRNYISTNMNGDIIRSRNSSVFVGKFRGSAKGFGFITPLNGEDDIYVFDKNVNGAIDGDIVLAREIRSASGTKKAEAKIEVILEESKTPLVGLFIEHENFAEFIFDNKKITYKCFINTGDYNGATNNDKVVINIIEKAGKDGYMIASVKKVLGKSGDVGLDILSIAILNEIGLDFPDKVLKEIEHIPTEVSEDVTYGRTDLTDKLIITIDGEDAKDLDDAISIEKLDNGNYYLGVHIADVTHYVTENTALDAEAQERATSVYLVDRVIPMLPRKLSNGICSLNPKVLRLTLSCFMEIDNEGNVIKSKIEETFIKTTERMTYTDVNKIINGDEELIEKYKHIVPMLQHSYELSKILIEKRDKRGAIDFNFPETKVILNEEGKPIEIKPYDRNNATRLIEEFMIICNETVCHYCSMRKLPFVYRIHEKPDPERLARLRVFLSAYGYFLSGKINSKTIQEMLKTISGKQEEFAINQMMLRSLSKAKYSPDNAGHFGLASSYYCHFTSPIRRYPDLQIHRIIKKHLNGTLYNEGYKSLNKTVEKVSKNSSEKEQKAAEAERDSIKLKEVEFMSDRIGEEFEGCISGITENNLFVQLPNTIEGIVPTSTLPTNNLKYDSDFLTLECNITGEVYKLGDKIFMKLIKTDLERRSIQFEFISKI